MIIKFDGSPFNLRDKQQIENKKKSEPVESSKTTENKISGSKKNEVADIISIRNENKLAASSSIRTLEDATVLADMLKKKFTEDVEASLNAHRKTDPDTVMQFYPFE